MNGTLALRRVALPWFVLALCESSCKCSKVPETEVWGGILSPMCRSALGERATSIHSHFIYGFLHIASTLPVVVC